MTVQQKTIAIYAKNEAYIHYASAWFQLRGYNVIEINILNDTMREQYKVLDHQIWDNHEFEEFLNG